MKFGQLDINPAENPGVLDTGTWDVPAACQQVRAANLNNLALGVTAIHVLWINRTLLPQAVRPRWYSQLGLVACAVFYLGLALLVFISTQLPMLREMLR